MQMPSETQEENQDSIPVRIDLTEIARSHPVNQQIAVLDLNTFDATQLTLLEVLDMSDTVGMDPELLGTLLSSGSQTSKRMRLLYAMAWCVGRRANPQLTFEEVCTWKLEIIGEVSEEKTEQAKKRAAVIVGAASISGLSPKDAGNLTIAELGAYTDRVQRRNRAARRRKTG